MNIDPDFLTSFFRAGSRLCWHCGVGFGKEEEDHPDVRNRRELDFQAVPAEGQVPRWCVHDSEQEISSSCTPPLSILAIRDLNEVTVKLKYPIAAGIDDPDRNFGRESRSLKAAYELMQGGWTSSNLVYMDGECRRLYGLCQLALTNELRSNTLITGGFQQWKYQDLPCEADE